MADGIDFVWHGWDQMRAALDKMGDAADEATRVGIIAAGQVLVDSTRHQFGAGSGPRSRTGTLAGSVKATDPVRVGFGSYELKVGPQGVAYARVVELGKKGARHRRPHPYLRPGYKAAASKFGQTFRQSWGKGIGVS